MTKFYRAVLGLFLMLFLAGSACAASQYIEKQEQKIKKENADGWRTCGKGKGPIRIATYATNPPFGWTEMLRRKTDVLYSAHGYDIDFMKQLLTEMKIRHKVQAYKNDSDMVADFYGGRLDMIVGAYYDPKLKTAGHHFLTPALIQNLITVVFMKGKEKEIHKFEDLVGLKGVVRQDEQFYQYMYTMIPAEAEIEQVPDSRMAFTKLLTGEADYLLTSPYAAEAEGRRFKMNEDFYMLPTPLLGQELFIMFSKKSPCKSLAGDIAKKLREKRTDMHAMKRELIFYIDRWGERFRDDAPLAEQLKSDTPISPESDMPVVEETEAEQDTP